MKTVFYTVEEYEKVYREIGISEEDYYASLEKTFTFRAQVVEREEYFYTKLNYIIEFGNKENVARTIFIVKRDELYIVAVEDPGDEIRADYSAALAACPPETNCVEKFIAAYFRENMREDHILAEEAYRGVSELEELIIDEKVDSSFNRELHNTKNYLLAVRSYYDQFIDLLEVLEDNYNKILDENNTHIISRAHTKVSRLRDDIVSLIELLSQLQSSYSSYLDSKMNGTMKLLTIITTIFMPLTLIVGWYGMNFNTMPEVTWEYGYKYVIILSIVLSLAVIIIARIKKWF